MRRKARHRARQAATAKGMIAPTAGYSAAVPLPRPQRSQPATYRYAPRWSGIRSSATTRAGIRSLERPWLCRFSGTRREAGNAISGPNTDLRLAGKGNPETLKNVRWQQPDRFEDGVDRD